MGQFSGFGNESLNQNLLLILCLLARFPMVEVSELLAHLTEETVLECLELAEGHHFRLHIGGRGVRSLDEVEDISLFLLGDLAFGDILKNAAKSIVQSAIFAKFTQGLNGYLVEAPFIEEGPGLITGDAVIH